MKTALTHIFTVNPELAVPTPRPVRYTRDARIIRGALLLLLISSVALVLGLAKHDLSCLQLLHDHGLTTQGIIYTKHESSGSRSASYRVGYRYFGSSKVIADTLSVSFNDYQNTQIGDQVTVTYLPSEPTLHRIGTVTQDNLFQEQAFWAGCLFLVFAIFGGAWFYSTLQFRESRKLLSEGHVTLGTIVSRRIIENKPPTHFATYEFLVNGRRRMREVNVNETRYEYWQEGTSVVVLYDPNNLSNNEAYVLMPNVTLAVR